jgi:hypothetical protein
MLKIRGDPFRKGNPNKGSNFLFHLFLDVYDVGNRVSGVG